MKFKRGYAGQWFVVFSDECQALPWEWLFCGVFRMHWHCFAGYMNAFGY